MSSDNLERRVDDSPDFERNVAEILHHRHRWRWWLLWVWMIIFTVAVGYGIKQNRNRASENRTLVEQNSERINDIQDSRVLSCKANYKGVEKVFVAVFLPADKKNWTTQQKQILKRFDKKVIQLQQKCPKQTRSNR